MEILQIIQSVAILFCAVVVHEYAHGWVALRRGDPTAKLMGRLTLNPLKHIDPVGTIAVPILLAFLIGTPVGWAKPVPVNFARLRNPRQDMIWVALAGPAVNVIMALGLAAGLHVLPLPGWAASMAILGILINVLLAVFNLIPVPPLDGSRVLMGLLPLPLARQLMRVEPWGFLVILVLLQTHALDGVWDLATGVTFRLVPARFWPPFG